MAEAERRYLADFKEYKDKNILITGGAGCIGSNLTKALIKAEASKIIVLDDLSAAEKWNVPVDPSVVFIEGSILNDEILKRAFSDKVDYVFHLAAHFANQNSVDNPETDLDVNGKGILKVLQYSHIAKVKRFVYASSGCSVYGSQSPLPLKEDYVSLHLDTPYQITKLLGELYCNYFYNQFKLPVAICRYFNVCGNGEIPGAYRNVIPNFIWWAMHNQPLPITGTGEETRDFTHVSDIVDGTLRLGIMPEAVGDAFNLASGKETKVIDIAKAVLNITGSKAGIVNKPRRDWDKITKRRASIEKAKQVIGYEPKVNMDTAIIDAFQWVIINKERIEACAKF